MCNNNLKTLLALLTSALILASCNKNDDYHDHNPWPGTKKLWKIKTNESDSTLFAYTTSGQLHRVITTEEGAGNDVVTYTFLYDPTSKITEISSSTGLKYKFLYEGGSLKFTENYVGANKVSENYFEVINGKINSATLLLPSQGNNGNVTYRPSLKTTYTYDVAGNVIRVSSYIVNPNTNALTKISEKQINQYDANRNPLEILSTLTLVRIYELPGKNNIVKETVYDDEGHVEETKQNSYVYDSKNYPVESTSTITVPGGTPTNIKFKYYYK